jgi:signal transduction histidine kinase
MSDTIDNFRNFFKPDTQKEFFEVSKSIELAIGFVQNSLENKHVKIVFENKALNNTILGYTKEFSQVLLNIFNNSNDAFDKNITDNPQITIITSDEGNEVLIKVVDNGGGISDDVIEKIFDPYFTTKHKSKGTGVGLYMSKMIVESMNGSITATNTENGAIVEIRLPTQNSSNG